MDPQEIADLIVKKINASISAEEESDLMNWMGLSEMNRETAHYFFVEETRLKGLQQHNIEDRGWQKIENRILVKPVPADSKIVKVVKFGWVKYAAAILIIVGCACAYLFVNRSPRREVDATISPMVGVEDIRPGQLRAKLTLSDGSTIDIDSAGRGLLAKQGTSTVTKTQEGQIVYRQQKTDEKHNNVLSFNTLTTPRGRQYHLTLSDGTNVWLNAASSITFPVQFAEGSRLVSVSGEAYFEVSKKANQPFIVNTNVEKIEVLGTAFNVNAYADEAASKVSLVEGVVRIQNQLLQPGQAYIRGRVASTNIEQDIAWKNGFFSFDNASLAVVMRQLERWYDVRVTYPKGIPPIAMAGEMSRTLTLNQVLRGLKTMGINYTIKGKTIIVMP